MAKTFLTPVLLPGGTQALPPLGFAADPDSGLWLSGTQLYLVTAGGSTIRFGLANGTMNLSADQAAVWFNQAGGAGEWRIFRNSAGASSLFFYDSANARYALTLGLGAVGTAWSAFNSLLSVGKATAPASMLDVAGPVATAVAAKTAAYTVTATDSVIFADATSAAFTVTLPSPVGCAGRRYSVKRLNSGANAVSVACAQLVDGAATVALSAQYQGLVVVSDGATWQVETGWAAAAAGGATILTGSGIPAAGTGANGDFYLDSNTRTLYGPKAAGSWGSPNGSVREGAPSGSGNAANSHAEGSGTTASGVNAHAEGDSSTASGPAAHAEGGGTQATGTNSHAEGGSTTATAFYAHAEGFAAAAGGNYSHAEGFATAATGESAHAQGNYSSAGRNGQHSLASGRFANGGDAQAVTLVARRQTTDATASVLFLDGGTFAILTGPTTNVLTIPVGRAHRFRIEAVARRTDGTADVFAAWRIEGVLVRPASGNARFVGTPVVVSDADAGASTWGLVVSIDTSNATNNYLALTATGQAAATIRWVARIDTTEVG